MKEQHSQLQEKDVRPKIVGWLGPKGTFTEKAAKIWQARKGSSKVDLANNPSSSITAIFKGVLDGSVDIGIVPIENTIGGPVGDTHAALEELSGITIVGEVVLPIQQYFYCQDAKRVTTIVSKDQALAQAAGWIDANYPLISKLEIASTSLAVQMAAENPIFGAIAGENTADELGLTAKLKRTYESVEDNKANTTTFAAIVKNPEISEPTGNDKTTAIMELPNRVGSLYAILAELAQRNINLTKIKSLRKTNGDIRFLISVDGHQKEERIRSSLPVLISRGMKLRILGSYPKDIYIPKHKIEPNMKNAIQMIERETQNGDADNKDDSVIVFNLPNKTGSLAKVLKVFADRNIKLSKIDSMPSGNFEEYIFYLSFNRNNVDNQEALLKEIINYSMGVAQLR